MWFYGISQEERDLNFLNIKRCEIDKVFGNLPRSIEVNYLYYIEKDFSYQTYKSDLEVIHQNLLKIESFIKTLEVDNSNNLKIYESQKETSTIDFERNAKVIIDLQQNNKSKEALIESLNIELEKKSLLDYMQGMSQIIIKI